MAKISAYGATEVARIKVRSPGGVEMVYVMASSGRVLTRYVGDHDRDSNYTLRGRTQKPERINQEFLIQIAERDGMTVITA